MGFNNEQRQQIAALYDKRAPLPRLLEALQCDEQSLCRELRHGMFLDKRELEYSPQLAVSIEQEQGKQKKIDQLYKQPSGETGLLFAYVSQELNGGKTVEDISEQLQDIGIEICPTTMRRYLHAGMFERVLDKAVSTYRRENNQAARHVNGKLSKNLRYLAEAQSATMRDIARETGITPYYTAQYLRGEAIPDNDTIKLLARYFSIPQSSLTDTLIANEIKQPDLPDVITPEMEKVVISNVCQVLQTHRWNINILSERSGICKSIITALIKGTRTIDKFQLPMLSAACCIPLESMLEPFAAGAQKWESQRQSKKDHNPFLPYLEEGGLSDDGITLLTSVYPQAQRDVTAAYNREILEQIQTVCAIFGLKPGSNGLIMRMDPKLTANKTHLYSKGKRKFGEQNWENLRLWTQRKLPGKREQQDLWAQLKAIKEKVREPTCQDSREKLMTYACGLDKEQAFVFSETCRYLSAG